MNTLNFPALKALAEEFIIECLTGESCGRRNGNRFSWNWIPTKVVAEGYTNNAEGISGFCAPFPFIFLFRS